MTEKHAAIFNAIKFPAFRSSDIHVTSNISESLNNMFKSYQDRKKEYQKADKIEFSRKLSIKSSSELLQSLKDCDLIPTIGNAHDAASSELADDAEIEYNKAMKNFIVRGPISGLCHCVDWTSPLSSM